LEPVRIVDSFRKVHYISPVDMNQMNINYKQSYSAEDTEKIARFLAEKAERGRREREQEEIKERRLNRFV
jgi:hypothetical protein